MKKEIFKQLVLDFQGKDLGHVVDRDINIPLNLNKPIALVGVRRSGKTFVLFSLIRELRKTVDPRNIIYINFEDDRLHPLQLSDLNLLLEGYFELFPEKKKEMVYLFLDEIQNIPGWETFVRRVLDTENCRICITGSSAKLLSKEIATALRGRNLTYEIFPLSFKEFLTFKEVAPDDRSTSGIARIRNAFNDFLIRGGFPEVVHYDNEIYTRTLQEYLDLVMYKDIVDRFNVSNTPLLKHLMRFCFINISKLISTNKIYNDFKSQGLRLSKNTIYEYISYFEDAYGAFTVSMFTDSLAQEMRNPKKLYSVDTGFKRVMDYSYKKDTGYIYENIVFIELRRQMKDIFYYTGKQEVDFCFKKEGKPYLLNVSYDIKNPTTRKREITGLAEAMDYFSADKSTLITSESDEIVKLDNKTIRIVPLWKWLLYPEYRQD